MWKTTLFSGTIYAADKNFTRPPVATVATNFKSAYESRLINQLAMIGHGPNKNHTEDIVIFVSTKHYKFLGWEWNNHSSKGEIVCVCVQILRVVSQYLTTHDCPLIHIITIILLLLAPSDTCFCPVGRSVDTF